MTDKPSRAAERDAVANGYADTDDDQISEPTIPIADKGEVARARAPDDAPADGLSDTPRPRAERAETIATEDGLVDPAPAVQPLDFDDGSLPTDALTQGESVVDAAFNDRGPADHLTPDSDER